MQPVNKDPKIPFSPPPQNRDYKALGALFAFTLAGTALFSSGKRRNFTLWNSFNSAIKKVKIPGFPHLLSYAKPSMPGWKIPNSDKVFKAFGVAALALPALMFDTKKKEYIPEEPLILSDVPKNHPIREEVTLSIVGHEADFLIKGTEHPLEGSTLISNAQHLDTAVQLFEEKGVISSETAQKSGTIFQDLQYNALNEIDSEDLRPEEKRALEAQGIATKVFALKPKESFYMGGGWSDKEGGHALVYKFTKKEDGLYDIYIYNTGAGTEKYHAHLLVEEGTRKSTLICPYVKFQGVPPSRLGFFENEAHPEFFKRLL